jgi:7,8-dihydroneopterin aldolase/epimerase/oxygenase
MGTILLEDIEFYAYHGHLAEERTIGARFLVNLEMETEFEEACLSDRLEDTFDYQHAYDIVSAEMKLPSALLEHVAARIANRILSASIRVQSVKICISKMNPPLGGNVKAVAIELTKYRMK